MNPDICQACNGEGGMTEVFDTRATLIKPGLYGCRLIYIPTGLPWCEVQCERHQIGDAFFSMLRMADKLGYDSPMARASRRRQKRRDLGFKFIWHDPGKEMPA